MAQGKTPNQADPGVTVNLDIERTFKWTFEAVKTIERETGINLRRPGAHAALFEDPNLTLTCAMIRGMLAHRDPGGSPEMTMEEALQLLADYGWDAVVPACLDAYIAGTPRARKDATADPSKTTASPPSGSNSGPSPATTSG